MQLFNLIRDIDETGVSGTGNVAQGVIFDTGKCILQWLTKHNSTTIFDSIDELEAVHGHGGKTRIVPIAHDNEQFTERLHEAVPTTTDKPTKQDIAKTVKPASATKEAVDVLKDVIRKLEDKEQKRAIIKYAKLIANVSEINNKIHNQIEEKLDADTRTNVESILQDIQAKILDTNGDILEFSNVVTERATMGKGELAGYFMNTLDVVQEAFKVVERATDKWLSTIVENPQAIEKEMFEKAVKWLHNRVDGPLSKISDKNDKLAKILDKMRMEQVKTEALQYILRNR